jgi:hypothetical protein
MRQAQHTPLDLDNGVWGSMDRRYRENAHVVSDRPCGVYRGFHALFVAAAELLMSLIAAKREDRLDGKPKSYDRYDVVLSTNWAASHLNAKPQHRYHRWTSRSRIGPTSSRMRLPRQRKSTDSFTTVTSSSLPATASGLDLKRDNNARPILLEMQFDPPTYAREQLDVRVRRTRSAHRSVG